MFQGIIVMVPSMIKCSKFGDVATPGERLCLALRYLATGDSQSTIASCDCVSPPVVGRIIHNTCDAIWTILNPKEYLKGPANNNEKMNGPNFLLSSSHAFFSYNLVMI